MRKSVSGSSLRLQDAAASLHRGILAQLKFGSDLEDEGEAVQASTSRVRVKNKDLDDANDRPSDDGGYERSPSGQQMDRSEESLAHIVQKVCTV